MSTFGENLYNLRKSRGYSQVKVAKLLHCSQASITAWETGKRIPDINSIKKIAAACNVPVSSLLPLEETKLYDDDIREIIDFISKRSDIRKLFSLVRFLSEKDVDVLIRVATAIKKPDD